MVGALCILHFAPRSPSPSLYLLIAGMHVHMAMASLTFIIKALLMSRYPLYRKTKGNWAGVCWWWCDANTAICHLRITNTNQQSAS
jgi:hypothetical protein